jgi:hypothetical protein
MEVPDLSLPSIWRLDDHVSVVDEIEISVFFQLRDNIEITVNIESEIRVDFTLGWFLWILVSIDNFPLLINFSVFVVNLDISVLII